MSHAKETTLFVDLLKKPVHNAIRHFSCYIVKLGFTGYTLFFLFLLKNRDCGYSLELPSRGSSNKYPQSMF